MKIQAWRLDGIKRVYIFILFFKNINMLSMFLSAAAEGGDPVAQCVLAKWEMKEPYPNITEAVEWYQKGMIF
jgi:hypothetical protein